MIKIMFVDDEVNYYSGLKKMIEKVDNEFKITSYAENGLEALEKLKTEQIDIIISDIKMPVMDGISLMQEVTNLYPQIQKVIFSAYPDFDYAKQVMKFGVHEYLIKPPTEEKISDVLKTLKNEYNNQQDITKYNVLRRGIDQGIDENIFYSEYYTIVILCIGSWCQVSNNGGDVGSLLLNEVDAFSQKLYTNEDIYDACIYQGKQSNEIIYILFHDKQIEDELTFSNVFMDIFKCNKMPVTIALNKNFTKLSTIHESINNLRNSIMKNSIFSCNNYILLQENDSNMSYDKTLYKMNDNDIFTIEDVKSSIKKLLNECNSRKITQYQLLAMLRHALFNNLSSINIVDKDLDYVINNILYDTCSYEVLYSRLTDLIDNLYVSSGNTKNLMENYHNIMVNNLKKYIHNNISTKLTLNSISKKFNMSPNHLSNIFRNCTGKTLSEYIIHARVRKAKEIIRENPSILMKDVADRVGYSDPLYFSKSFKKIFGKSPTEYFNNVD